MVLVPIEPLPPMPPRRAEITEKTISGMVDDMTGMTITIMVITTTGVVNAFRNHMPRQRRDPRRVAVAALQRSKR